MASRHEKVVIIGAGAAGLTAAIYAARANLQPVILTGLQPGGQLTITTDVENYPGFADVVQGPWLMQQMQAQAENVGTRVIYDLITELDASTHPFTLTCDSGDEITADSVILATGASARWLGLDLKPPLTGAACRPVRPVTGFSIGIVMWWLSAAAIQLLKKRCIWPISAVLSRWFTAAIRCARNRLCRTG